MGQGQAPFAAQLPSFSLVLETENLANANHNDLSKSLLSLANQDLSPTYANEVLLIDSGDTPTNLLEQLCEKYPWIKVHQTQSAMGYYKAKMLGAELVTGEIVVYCDSDCIYEPNWLSSILTLFTQGEVIQIVAGETVTRGKGPYGTAMALTYIFPQRSRQQALTKTSQYFLNNVAFRRLFLLQHPIPAPLPLYRGNCVIHAHKLRQQGYILWKQPQARANHAPPSNFSHFFWRFLLIGHDAYWQKRLLAEVYRPSVKAADPQQQYRSLMSGLRDKLQIFWDRFQSMLADNPRHLIYLPFAIPIIIASMTLMIAGYLITVFNPHYLLHTYNQILDEGFNAKNAKKRAGI